MERPYEMEQFQPHTGESFVAKCAGHDVDLELTEVQPGPENPHAISFSLFFRGPRSQFMPQAIYEITHGKLGTLSLFLVPVAESAEGFVYQAVFNLLKEPAKPKV